MNKIYIFGGDHHNTVGLIRSIGESSLDCTIIALIVSEHKSPFTIHSKYVNEYKIVPTEDDGLNYLIEIGNTSCKGVLLCAGDGPAAIVDNNLNKLQQYYYLASAKNEQSRITYYMVKDHITDLAKKVGFDVPKSWTINDISAVPDEISFPCITKPLASIEGSKQDIIVSRNRKSLNETLNRILLNGCNRIQIQEYIEKEYELNALGCSLNHGDCVILPGIIRKIREYPIGMGSSSFSVELPFELYDFELNKICNLIKLVGYTGLFSIEFVHKDGINYFLEVNFRNDGNGYIPTAAGVNLPYILCRHLIDGYIPDEIPVITKPFYFMSDLNDIKHVISGRLSIWTWLKDLCRTDCFLLLNRKDLAPSNVVFRHTLKRLFYKLTRKA